MTTNAITIAYWNASKFSNIPVTQATLDLINKSETLKGDIRAYETSDAARVTLLTDPQKAGSGSYRVPTAAEVGELSVGTNRVNTPQDTFDILSHELGHFKVEGIGAVISVARADAVALKSQPAYEAACHLTEGYGKYNETIARREVLAADKAQAQAEGRAPTRDEDIRAIAWGLSRDEVLLQDFERLAVQFGAPFETWTADELRNAAIFAMGENNKQNFTSTTNETYAEFCKRGAFEVIGKGESSTTPPSASLLETEFDSTGQAVGSDFSTAINDGSQGLYASAQAGSGNEFNAFVVSPTGPTTYTIETTVGGNGVTATGTKDATGNILLTGITEVNGQPPESTTSAVTNAALTEAKLDVRDILVDPARVLPYVEAVDKTNPDGTTPSLVEQTGRPDWWNDPRIGTLGSDALSLLSAVRGGSPLPIFTATLNFASHQLADPAVGEIAAALSAVGSLKGLIDGLERGDLGRILIDGGGIARSAVTIHSGGGKHTRNIEAAVMIGQAVQLKSSGNARKSNTIAKYLYRTWENTVFGRKIGNHVAFEAANDRMWAAAA
jgi:hypothetical protein